MCLYTYAFTGDILLFRGAALRGGVYAKQKQGFKDNILQHIIIYESDEGRVRDVI
jgi:hypothetical protein